MPHSKDQTQGSEILLISRMRFILAISAFVITRIDPTEPRHFSSAIYSVLALYLEKLRAFFGGDHCVAVLHNLESGTFSLRRATADDPEAATRAEPISEELAKQLMSFGEEECIFFKSGRWEWGKRSDYQRENEKSRRAAELLGASSFLSVPMRSMNRGMGRLFVTARSRSFDSGELDFLRQTSDSFMPVMDNIILVDKMATRAAEEERQRIARDIHDRIVQPYIGLQLGIESIRQFFDLDTGENLLTRLSDRVS